MTPPKLAFTLLLWLLGSALAGALSPEQTEKMEKGVFRIFNYQKTAGVIGFGTGFLINDQSTIVTNYHVVDNAIKLFIVRQIGNQIKVWPAEIIYVSGLKDIALLNAPGVEGEPFLLEQKGGRKGEDVYAVGFPGQADNSREMDSFLAALKAASWGNIPLSDNYENITRSTVKRGNIEDVRMADWGYPDVSGRALGILHNAPQTSGNSGGPLFNDNLHIVGINTWIRGEGATSTDSGKKVQLGNVMRASLSVTELIGLLNERRVPYQSTGLNLTQNSGPNTNSQLSKPDTSRSLIPTPIDNSKGNPGSNNSSSDNSEVEEEKDKGFSTRTWIFIAVLGLGITSAAMIGIILLLTKKKGDGPTTSPLFTPNTPGAAARPGIGIAQAKQPPPRSLASLAPAPSPSPSPAPVSTPPPNHSPNPQRASLPRPTPSPTPTPSPSPTPAAVPPPTLTWALAGKDLEGKTHRLTLDSTMFARKQGKIVIGRSASHADLAVENTSMSRAHAEIRLRNGKLHVVDLHSSNGSKVNRTPLAPNSESAALRSGDCVEFGEVSLTFNESAPR